MKFLFCFIASLVLLQACKKDHFNTTVPTDLGKPYGLGSTSKASIFYDHSNYGIYKGVTINAGDSLATFQIDLANNGKSVYALQFMDSLLRDSLIRLLVDSVIGITKYPQEEDTSIIKTGLPYHTVFSSFNLLIPGTTLLQFEVNGDGSSPLMEANLLGNQTLNAVLKEKSDKQVFCYEGVYEGTYLIKPAKDNGLVAFALTTDTVIAILKDKAYHQFFPAACSSVINNQFTIEITDGPGGANFVFTGYVSGNICSGTWIRKNSIATGTFSSHRTL